MLLSCDIKELRIESRPFSCTDLLIRLCNNLNRFWWYSSGHSNSLKWAIEIGVYWVRQLVDWLQHKGKIRAIFSAMGDTATARHRRSSKNGGSGVKGHLPCEVSFSISWYCCPLRSAWARVPTSHVGSGASSGEIDAACKSEQAEVGVCLRNGAQRPLWAVTVMLWMWICPHNSSSSSGESKHRKSFWEYQLFPSSWLGLVEILWFLIM